MARRRHGTFTERSRERSQAESQQNLWIVTEKGAAVTHSIANAVVVKNLGVSLLTDPEGNIPLKNGHGLGLYFDDCRYLKGYELKLGASSDAGVRPIVLASIATEGHKATFQLTNPNLKHPDGSTIKKEQIGIDWARVIDGEHLALHEILTFRNHGMNSAEFPVELTFDAAFEDTFEVRGYTANDVGSICDHGWREGALSYVYHGTDGLYRSTTLQFWPEPDRTAPNTAAFLVRLKPGESQPIAIKIQLSQARALRSVDVKPCGKPDLGQIEAKLDLQAKHWYNRHANLRSDHELLDRIVARSLHDLHTLRNTLGSDGYFSAGVPWYMALFGRDSLITALQTLAYDPSIAEQTLKLHAAHQGRTVDHWRDEQPGKILHEYRTGELTRNRELPFSPYYGTVDATPLFLILLCEHANWTGDTSLFTYLSDNIDAALKWIGSYGDLNGDGYVSYQTQSEKGLSNQGWKDSGDAIVNADGSLATQPIALVEVQGYVYRAKTMLAKLFRRLGDSPRADQLEREAKQLRLAFNRDFWLPDLGFYALALQAGQRPCAVIASNPGQAMWGGIIDQERAPKVVERMLKDDMFSGWGIRTLSSHEKRFNPIGYHLGTVWPHDNSLIAAGFKRYGFDDAAQQVFDGLYEAASHFDEYRMPELFTGYAVHQFGEPVRYPVACHPQAWAAGSIPYLIHTLLGLEGDGFARRLRVVRPRLPGSVRELEFKHLRVGTATVDLRFSRNANRIQVAITHQEGPLDLIVEP